MVIGFLHLGPPEHGVCRYGRLLANEAKKRANLTILEQEVLLRGDRCHDIELLKKAAYQLSGIDIVHFQFTEAIWGTDQDRLHNIWTFIKTCCAPLAVTIHDTEPNPKLQPAVLESEKLPGHHILARLKWFNANLRFVSKVLLSQYGLTRRFIPGNAWIRDWLIRKCRVSFVCTPEEQRRLSAITPSEHLVVVPHFIEERVSLPPREEARKSLNVEGRKVITLLGFIYDGKGYRILLEALALLPDPDILVVFAGGPVVGYEDFVTDMRNLAKTLGVADRVRITGYLAEKELEYYLVATDIPVCPYKVCYASGSLSSWLSAGRLVLASALPQFQEYNRIEPGTIRTFSPYTPMALAHAIQAMLALSSPGVNDMVLRLRDQLAIQVIFDKHLQYIINPLRF